MRRICIAASVAALAVGVVAIGAPGSLARATKPKIAKVCDYYFTPTTLRIKKGSRVRWKWATGCGVVQHDVKLTKAPSGVNKSKYRSPAANSPYSFTRRFRKRGNYHFICTFHSDLMQMTVRVHR